MTERSIEHAPRPGDIWSCIAYERRARVLRVYENGRVRLKTVVLIGGVWQDKVGGMASTCSPGLFAEKYRLLVRGV